MKHKLATLFGTFFISLNASIGIRKSRGVEELDRAHKVMFPNKGKKKNNTKWGRKFY